MTPTDSTINSIKRAAAKLSSSTIVVVGDLMLDRFVWGEVSRISPEAPVPVVEVNRETSLLGGAANVAHNIISMGGRCILAGLTGNDTAGKNIKSLADQAGIETDAVITDNFQTTVKTRLIARGQQIARVDREDIRNDAVAPDSFFSQLKDAIYIADAIIVSDYNKGVITSHVMELLIKASEEKGIMILVDPKPSNSSVYNHVSLITPNRKEASALSGINISDIPSASTAASVISERFDIENILVTMGKDGMILWRRGKEPFTIPTTAMDVFDVTGAGDTVIALMGMGVASGVSMKDSAMLANIAAGIVVGKVGTATVNIDELNQAISIHVPF